MSANSCIAVALSSFKSICREGSHRCSLLRRCALRPRSFRRPPLDVDGCYEPFNLAVISGSAADSHPAYPPAMAVPETLCHPFATAKIVVMPVTWSVIAGPIIVALSRDACRNATLRACRRRGERTSDRCDRDEGSKCLLHSRALLQMTPSVSARWMHGKLLVAQTMAAAKLSDSVPRRNRTREARRKS